MSVPKVTYEPLLHTKLGQTWTDVQLDEQKRRDTIHYNEQVTKNCEDLRRLIDSVVYLGKNWLSECNYVELVSLISDYDSMLSNHLSIATLFLGTCNKIQKDFISSVSQVLLDAIKRRSTGSHVRSCNGKRSSAVSCFQACDC
ncbi:UNVERIFIED_CONTAM: hypothetical protein FKN15_062093 [Acipenser sinensis]